MRQKQQLRHMRRTGYSHTMTADRTRYQTLRTGEAAAALGVSKDTLRRWGDLGRIKYVYPHPWSTQRRYERGEIERVAQLIAETSDPTEQEPTP